MTSKERIRTAIQHKEPDRLPKDFIATPFVIENLKKYLKMDSYEDVLNYFDIDVRVYELTDLYTGNRTKRWVEDGVPHETTFWNYDRMLYRAGEDYNYVNTRFALDDDDDINDALDKYEFPNADEFDYSKITDWAMQHEGKALCFGHAGAYQMAATNLRNTELLFMDMACDPDGAHRLFDQMNNFLLAHYEKALEAGKGKIDILRVHDDYGTQLSTLFSAEMWRTYFKENLTKFVNLAHKYDCYFMQHSCGAIRSFIPELIGCGVDVLDPIQKVVGLEIEGLKADFGDKITFHGGIDTQFLLPNAPPEEVKEECKHFINVLNKNGGYIFTSSQHLQGDVPLENILAMYDRL